MIHLGTKDLENLHLGTKQINRVLKGTQVVWENWKFHSGNLYAMTSNNWNGFVASSDGGENPPYYLFDNNANTSCTNLNGNLPPWNFTLMFPKLIRIQELRTCLNADLGPDGFGYKGYNIQGIKEDDTLEPLIMRFRDTTDLWSTNYHTRTLTEEQQKIAFKGLKVELVHEGGWGWYHPRDCLVSKWFEKGGN